MMYVHLSVDLSVCLSQTSTLNLHSAEGATVSHDALQKSLAIGSEAYRLEPSGWYTCYYVAL